MDSQLEIYTRTYPISYTSAQTDGMNVLTYRTDQDSTVYHLQEGSKEGVYFYHGEEEQLWLVDEKEYKVDGKVYPIYKYAMNRLVTDGCITHFWSPELGILLAHSATWSGFSRIKASDDQKNVVIDQVSNIIMNDRKFYGGC